MFVVAICELATSVDEEAQALVSDLGGTAYEHRLRLAGGFPAIVITTADRELAERNLAGLRSRGHGAVGCDSAAVVASERMVSMRRFQLEPDAVIAEGPTVETLPASDVLALLRATHRTEVETRHESRTKQFSAGRAVLTGGLMFSKSVKREERSSSSEIQQVLYIFRNSGERPWLLAERGTHFGALGQELSPSSMQNFMTTIRRLRALAPAAVYDERLLRLRSTSGPPIQSGSFGFETVTSSSAGGIDLAAHLLALWLQGKRAAYR